MRARLSLLAISRNLILATGTVSFHVATMTLLADGVYRVGTAKYHSIHWMDLAGVALAGRQAQLPTGGSCRRQRYATQALLS